jgi:hypothetical protein
MLTTEDRVVLPATPSREGRIDSRAEPVAAPPVIEKKRVVAPSVSAGVASSRFSDTTRYLCAAAQTDAAFRESVVASLLRPSFKAMAASHGVDLKCLLKHCCAARQRVLLRNLGLSVVGVAALGFLGAENFAAVFLLLLIGFGIVFGERLHVERRIIARLRKGCDDPDFVNVPLTWRLEQALQRIHDEQNRNFVVYSGFSPFVGAGIDIGGWSFAIDVSKGKVDTGVEATPDPFDAGELYARLEADLGALRLDGFEVQDRLYANGQDIRSDPRLLPDPLRPPVAQLDPALVRSFTESPNETIRHYKCFRLFQWRGELVTSLFFRGVKYGNTLFLEASYLLLTPVLESYHRLVDSVPAEMTFTRLLQTASLSAVMTPFLCFLAPLFVLYRPFAAYSAWVHHRQTKTTIKNDYSFDYGASASIRAAASSPNYRRYFQKLDKEMSFKMMESQVLHTLVSFLDSKNIDTSDLKERQTTILNNGVIVAGGSIQAKNFSGGQGATSILSHLKGAAAKAGSRLAPAQPKTT